jgi:hypothetical protein
MAAVGEQLERLRVHAAKLKREAERAEKEDEELGGRLQHDGRMIGLRPPGNSAAAAAATVEEKPRAVPRSSLPRGSLPPPPPFMGVSSGSVGRSADVVGGALVSRGDERGGVVQGGKGEEDGVEAGVEAEVNAGAGSGHGGDVAVTAIGEQSSNDGGVVNGGVVAAVEKQNGQAGGDDEAAAAAAAAASAAAAAAAAASAAAGQMVENPYDQAIDSDMALLTVDNPYEVNDAKDGGGDAGGEVLLDAGNPYEINDEEDESEEEDPLKVVIDGSGGWGKLLDE